MAVKPKKARIRRKREKLSWADMPILYSCVTTPNDGYNNARMRFSFIPDLDSDWYRHPDEPPNTPRRKFEGRVGITSWYSESAPDWARKQNAESTDFCYSCHSKKQDNIPHQRDFEAYLKWMAQDVPGLQIGQVHD